MRIALVPLAVLLFAVPSFAADPVEGQWVTADGGSKVRIGACPGQAAQMCGVVSWLPANEVHDLDKRNPNAALRSRAILGSQTIFGFQKKAAGSWSGGKLYDPATGKTYSGKIAANPDGTRRYRAACS